MQCTKEFAAFSALASRKQKLCFGEICAATGICPANLECWLADAVAAGLVEVSIDQLNRSIYVKYVKFLLILQCCYWLLT